MFYDGFYDGFYDNGLCRSKGINTKILCVAGKSKVWRYQELRCLLMTSGGKLMCTSDPSQEGVISSPPHPFMRPGPCLPMSVLFLTFAVKPISQNLLRNCLVLRQIWEQCYLHQTLVGKLTCQRRKVLLATSSNCPQWCLTMVAQ